MKKKLLLLIVLCSIHTYANANTANLIDVYQQALTSDPAYQQAVAQMLATGEGVPISAANLLPNVGLAVAPSIAKELSSGPATVYMGSYKSRGYTVALNITQTIFNFSQFANLAQAKATAKQANAVLNAAAQNLIIRMAKAYFQVLEDEDNLRSSKSTKTAFAKQSDQIIQQYKAGIQTTTDVATAKASYEGSVADYIAVENDLANDKENLRAITGKLYPALARLSEQFPLISPQPDNIEKWVNTTKLQNWAIKAAQYALDAAQQNIKQQFAGHLPILNVQGTYDVNFVRNMHTSAATFVNLPGTAQTHNSSITLNLVVPVFSGGQVVAQTRQAQDNYQVAVQQLEQQVRDTLNLTRQSYLGIIAGISKIQADKQAINSAKNSVEGMEAGYRAGTETLVNVLNQQQQVFIDEKQYAHDRYAYINNLLVLKQVAGTLSPEDLTAINRWLTI
jgi:outer membrane protein